MYVYMNKNFKSSLIEIVFLNISIPVFIYLITTLNIVN